jgi:hypothetical protein
MWMIILSFLMSTPSLAIETAGDDVAEKWVCKRRTRQVYRAFYRTEVVKLPDGNWRFDYGIGDELQIYDLYFAALVIPVPGASEDQPKFVSPIGSNPQLAVEIETNRGRKELQFTMTQAGGKPDTRNKYICE